MMNDSFRHIIFDFDGTIADSMKLSIELFNQAAQKYKFKPISEESIEHLYKLSILDKCKALNVSLTSIPRASMEINRSYNRLISLIPLIKGIKEVILDLKQRGYTLSIISSNAGDNIKKFLAANNIDVFDHIYSAKNLFGKDKAISSFIKKNRIKKEEAVYIGDEIRDVVACKANNIKVIAVAWGGFESLDMLTKADPDFLVNDPAEIFAIIQPEQQLMTV
jgi:phosphoglycolate phosphatase